MKRAARKIDPCAADASIVASQDCGNYDQATIEAFSDQWTRFEESVKERDEDNKRIFDRFFFHFPWSKLPPKAKGYDMGCGRGRFLKFVTPHVGQIDAVDASPTAIQQAKKLNRNLKNVNYFEESLGNLSLKKESYDFGYSFGVLMCVPDTQAGIKECADLLKPGAPFCMYMYYNLDNRPIWYRGIWKITDWTRKAVSRLPKGFGFFITDTIAIFAYWPLAKMALIGEKLGADIHNWPLSDYRHSSFARMRGTSRDRFGTTLEKRFSREEITQMMRKAGFKDIKYYDGAPYWCMFGIKKGTPKKTAKTNLKTVSIKTQKSSSKAATVKKVKPKKK